MRKLSALGVCALVFTISLEQPAQAWLNVKFGAGVNWSWQAGGNSLCGLYRCGQPPGYGYADPSCMPKNGMVQQQCMPQQQCPPPWMWQQPYGPQGSPIFPNMGCQQNNYLDPTSVAYNGNVRTQSSYYGPGGSWNYPAAAPGYSSSYYGSYGASSNSYGQPAYQASYGYYPGYQAAPYNYCANYSAPWNYYSNTGWGYYYGR